jgi:hypothetical protein
VPDATPRELALGEVEQAVARANAGETVEVRADDARWQGDVSTTFLLAMAQTIRGRTGANVTVHRQDNGSILLEPGAAPT